MTNSFVSYENFIEFDHKTKLTQWASQAREMYAIDNVCVCVHSNHFRNLHAKEVCAQWLSFIP